MAPANLYLTYESLDTLCFTVSKQYRTEYGAQRLN